VGVFKGDVPVHIAPDFRKVPEMIGELMEWARTTSYHPLIKSCIFHFQFEYIHPFVDGNGRMGRLWQSLILSKWKHIFAYLPVETWVKKEQQNYYAALQRSSPDNVAPFVVFMLRMIKSAIGEFVSELDNVFILSKNEKRVLDIVSEDPEITAAKMAEIMDLSERTVKRCLSALVERGYLQRHGDNRRGYWEVKNT
jgi:Fic family protein